MNDDIENSVCQIIVLQEVEPGFWGKMQARAERRNAAKRIENGGGTAISAPPPFFMESGAMKDRALIAF